MANDCVFCKIIRGELPSFKLYEDDKTLAFLDIHPSNRGHTLVIPKTHAANIFEISQSDWAAVCQTVHRLAETIEKAVEADGINVAMNNREHAGQIIYHAHVHLIQRFKGDGLRAWSHRDYKEGEAQSIKEKILANVKSQ